MRRTLVAVLLVAPLLASTYAHAQTAQNGPVTWCPAMDPLIDELTAMQKNSAAESLGLTGAEKSKRDCKAFSDLTVVLNQIVSTLKTCQSRGGVGLEPTIQQFSTIRDKTQASQAGCI